MSKEVMYRKEIKKITYVKGHNCRTIENSQVAVEKYNDGKWYLTIKRVSNQVLYCPYCGEKLE